MDSLQNLLLFQNAIYDNDLETIKKLIISGAVHHRGCVLPNGKDPYKLARYLKQKKILDWLHSQESYSDVDRKFINAVEKSDLESVKQLFSEEMINPKQLIWPDSEEVPLGIAAETGSIEMVKLLLELGFDPTLLCPLVCAVRKQHKRIIVVLLEAGANVNELYFEKLTPLMYAAALGNLEIVKLLVEAGAAIEMKDDDNQTALDKATSNQHDDVVAYLIGLQSP
jgi:ankyrin repeat protein